MPKRPSRRTTKSKSQQLTRSEIQETEADSRAATRRFLRGRANVWKRWHADAGMREFAPEAPRQQPDIKPNVQRALVGAPSRGTLIAQGDSWFDYPLHDVLKMLNDEHAYEIESVAHAGDRIENMAYNVAELDGFVRVLEKTLRRGVVPRAILLSGGGNDIAGVEFGMMLNHAGSSLPITNDDVVNGVLGKRIPAAYVAIITRLNETCSHYLTTPLPILMHGYAHPVPDGRGFSVFGWHWGFPGPWLKPGFDEKELENRRANTAAMQELIDRFNDVIAGVAAQFTNAHYLDLRPLLTNGPKYRNDWDNELHPTEAGFRLVGNEFARALASL
jgi:lysophospholipase L1-like esterase